VAEEVCAVDGPVHSAFLIASGDTNPDWVVLRRTQGILANHRQPDGSWQTSLFPEAPHGASQGIWFFPGAQGSLQALFQETYLPAGASGYRLFTAGP
jgi:hypothetical protein